MDRLKNTISGKEQWNGLSDFIQSIEQNRRANPNVSLDAAKSLLESICKTILTNKGIGFRSDSKLGYLVKQTFGCLPVFQSLEAKDVEAAKGIIGSLETIGAKIGEFRNEHGFFSHGQDIHGGQFDSYLTDLVITSTDVLTSFLISAYLQDDADKKRPFYEDFAFFNQWYDENNPWVEVENLGFSPSKVLFENDIEAFKEAFNEFCNNIDQIIEGLENSSSFAETHQWVAKLSECKGFTNGQRVKILKVAITNNQISWISSDYDINSFLASIYNGHDHCFSPEDIKQFKAIYLTSTN